AFEDAVPYVVALVELDAGPRLIANVVDIAPSDVAVGMRVTAAFEPFAEGAALVNFRAAGV
ncbi:MAG: OB-fold domain, acyl-CoA-associated, partial [Gaiellaceae bacterium]|nr:OB-fold domain, acyl-CoA-associated [Gaiellaceae bacterium]